MKNIAKLLFMVLMTSILTVSCRPKQAGTTAETEFTYEVDRFEDIRVLRYRVPGFDQLTLKQKQFIYYLSEAALCGRDILWDQQFKYNLLIRRTLEAIMLTYEGEREDNDFDAFTSYAKRVFFANGIHHHYSNEKFSPDFSREYFEELVLNSDPDELPLNNGLDQQKLVSLLGPVLFDEQLFPLRSVQTAGADMVAESAINFYEGVTQAEVESYYDAIADSDDTRPVSYGLNTKVIKEGDLVKELVWRSGGMYGAAIDKIIFWLEKAVEFAENETQKKELSDRKSVV